MSEFESTSLKEFLLIKLLDRPYHLFGWRFEIDRYAPHIAGACRGFWADRDDADGRVDWCLHWFMISRWPHSEKRKAA